MENEEKQTIVVEGQSVAYLKLTRNSRGYGWEIKQLSLDVTQLEKINNEILQKFGEQA
jgi:hypothetical protein